MIKPLLDYVSEVAEGKAKLAPGKAFSAFMKLSKEEKEEVSRFFSAVSEKGKAVLDDFEKEFPILAKEPAIYDVIGNVIDSILSGELTEYLDMFKLNNL